MILYGTNPIAWTNDDDFSIGAHLTIDDCLTNCQKIGFDGIEKGHLKTDFPPPNIRRRKESVCNSGCD